jgi:hypothetical protein
VHPTVPVAMLGETLVSAFAGLLGVVVGAVLAWWRERDQRRGETVSAARLLDAELAQTREKITIMVREVGGPAKPLGVELDTPAWVEGRAALAQGLDAEQWGHVRDAVASVSAFRITIERGASAAEVDSKGRTAIQKTEKAQDALAEV